VRCGVGGVGGMSLDLSRPGTSSGVAGGWVPKPHLAVVRRAVAAEAGARALADRTAKAAAFVQSLQFRTLGADNAFLATKRQR